MQISDSIKSTEALVQQCIGEGSSIFQGRHLSRPLESKLSRSSNPIKSHIIDLREQNKVLEYCKEDQVISVETGMTLSELAAQLQSNSQYLPVFAPKDLSLLEVINSGETGYFEHNYGLRSLVLGLEVLLASGEKIKTGGKVVKNVSGYDLTKLFLGARGTLGLPVKAHLRVYALHEQHKSLVVYGLEPLQLLSLSSKLLYSGLPLAGMEVIICNGSEITSQLPSDFLWISISEHRDVMTEVLPLLDARLLDAGAKVLVLSEELKEELPRTLADYFEWDFNILHSSASRVQMQKIILTLQQCGAYKMLYSPASGRLKLRFDDAEKLLQSVAVLTQAVLLGASLEGFDDLEVAYADDKFEYRLERLACNDDEIYKIKQQIKHKFDPLNLMNPLAKL